MVTPIVWHNGPSRKKTSGQFFSVDAEIDQKGRFKKCQRGTGDQVINFR